ncbi:DUF6573 family protein [Agromyces bauzanensis]
MTSNDEPEVIHQYTAEQAVADGALVHLSPVTALEAGYAITVLLTRAAYEEVVEWTRGGGWQSEDARFWDVLNVGRAAAKAALTSPGRVFGFKLLRVANRTPTGAPSAATTPMPALLEVRAEAFDTAGERGCLIISLPGEN